MIRAGLAAAGVSKRFGSLVAVDQVSVTLAPGEILGLIGPNGSGKSTLVNVITGLYQADSGTVSVDGLDVSGRSPTAVARFGVARTFQTVRLFSGLSVRDNVGAVMIRPKSDVDDLVDGYLSRLGLADVSRKLAGELPYGVQRRVEIARALATEPRYLLLDEPAAGMNDVESRQLETIIRQLAVDGDQPPGVLVIDHDLRLIMSLCERLVVLSGGKLLAEGHPEEVRQRREVVEAYLGTGRTR